MTLDLSSLKARVRQAHTRGYQIAWAEHYVELLGGKPAPEGVVPNSAEHLLHLIDLAQTGEPAPVTLESLPSAPEPVAEAQAEPVAAEPEAQAEPVAAEPTVEEKKSKKSKK